MDAKLCVFSDVDTSLWFENINYEMILQFIADVNWKHLLISALFAFCILFLADSLFASFKGEAFRLAVNSGNIQWSNNEDISAVANDFFHSPYWVPLQILPVIIAQFASCLYLMKNAKGLELTNGIAHGVFLAVFIYQLNLINSIIGVVVSLLVAYKTKSKKKAEIIEIKR